MTASHRYLSWSVLAGAGLVLVLALLYVADAFTQLTLDVPFDLAWMVRAEGLRSLAIAAGLALVGALVARFSPQIAGFVLRTGRKIRRRGAAGRAPTQPRP